MDWLIEAWRFLGSEGNREILAFLGAGIAAVGAAVWIVYTHFRSSGATAEAARSVTADGGGVAAGGGDVHFTQIVGCAPRFLRCARGPRVALIVATRQPPRPFRVLAEPSR